MTRKNTRKIMMLKWHGKVEKKGVTMATEEIKKNQVEETEAKKGFFSNKIEKAKAKLPTKGEKPAEKTPMKTKVIKGAKFAGAFILGAATAFGGLALAGKKPSVEETETDFEPEDAGEPEL